MKPNDFIYHGIFPNDFEKQYYNKYHLKIPLLGVDKSMLKFKKEKVNPNKIVRIHIALDQSSSMMTVQKDALRALNNQLDTYRKESKSNNISTYVSVTTFSSYVSTALEPTDIKEADNVDENSPLQGGNTAFYDAIGDAIQRVKVKYQGIGSDTSKVIIVITDGEENWSREYNRGNIKRMIKEETDKGFTSFVICCPPHKKKWIAEDLGIPLGNIMEWEGTKEGVERMDNSLQMGTQSFYKGVTRGMTTTQSYFTPALDTLTKTVVKSELDDVTKEYTQLAVGSLPQTVSDFISKNGFRFTVGCCYYQLTKKEEVQDFKRLILRDKSNGKLYTGDSIRSLIQIPSDGIIKLNPSDSPKYDIFIRSTSWNRKLVPNTLVLYKI